MRECGLFGSVLLALLAGCNAPTGNDARAANDAPSSGVATVPIPVASPTRAAEAPATPVVLPAAASRDTRSCTAEIGAAAAARLVTQCRNVSPATHPPCNVANSCALIRSEIARSCAVFADDAEPVDGCPIDARSNAAAGEVLRLYYQAIDAADYATAWQLWDDDGARSGKTLAAFGAGFADTASSGITLGTPGRVEGAAGSLYVTVPVTVEARLISGAEQRFKGSYVLRRANQPGSQGWRIYSATLTPAG